MADVRELAAMRRALELAAGSDVPVGPNPRVGAVVLDRSGVVVGEGFHRGAGTAHAEVDALTNAGDRANGATVVVTLEPCNHTGRTGPCTVALLGARVARVVFGQADRSQAAGGAANLLSAGVLVEGGVLAGEAASLNPEFTLAMTERRPFVTYKFAATLDGRIAAEDGSSQWITGQRAREDVHRLRSEVDAIVVGTGTALLDDPRLTARGPERMSSAPLRVVVGNRSLPADSRLLDAAAPTLQLRTHDPTVVLTDLFDRGVRHVLVEGGPTLAAAFFRARSVDRVVAYLSPMLLGAGPAALSGFGVGSIGQALRLHMSEVTTVGNDIRITASVVKSPLSSAEGK